MWLRSDQFADDCLKEEWSQGSVCLCCPRDPSLALCCPISLEMLVVRVFTDTCTQNFSVYFSGNVGSSELTFRVTRNSKHIKRGQHDTLRRREENRN